MWSVSVVLRRVLARVRREPALPVKRPEPTRRTGIAGQESGPQPVVMPDGPVIAAGLTAFGLGSGARIALMGLAPDGDRAAADALALLGAEVVQVPDHAHGPRLRLRLRGVRAVLTRSSCVPQIAAVVGDLPDLQHLWSWDAGGRDELAAAAQGRMPAFQE